MTQQFQNRKVLIALTDGEPALQNPRSDLLHIKECERVIAKITAVGVEPIGIGIMTQSVERFFPQHVVVDDLNELPKRFYRELSNILGV